MTKKRDRSETWPTHWGVYVGSVVIRSVTYAWWAILHKLCPPPPSKKMSMFDMQRKNLAWIPDWRDIFLLYVIQHIKQWAGGWGRWGWTWQAKINCELCIWCIRAFFQPHLSKLIKAFKFYKKNFKILIFFAIFCMFSSISKQSHSTAAVPLSMCCITYVHVMNCWICQYWLIEAIYCWYQLWWSSSLLQVLLTDIAGRKCTKELNVHQMLSMCVCNTVKPKKKIHEGFLFMLI